MQNLSFFHYALMVGGTFFLFGIGFSMFLRIKHGFCPMKRLWQSGRKRDVSSPLIEYCILVHEIIEEIEPNDLDIDITVVGSVIVFSLIPFIIIVVYEKDGNFIKAEHSELDIATVHRVITNAKDFKRYIVRNILVLDDNSLLEDPKYTAHIVVDDMQNPIIEYDYADLDKFYINQ